MYNLSTKNRTLKFYATAAPKIEPGKLALNFGGHLSHEFAIFGKFFLIEVYFSEFNQRQGLGVSQNLYLFHITNHIENYLQ